MTVEIFQDAADFEEPEEDTPGVVIVAIPSITDPIRTKTPEQDLHVTLCYLGKMNQGIEFLMQTLASDVDQVADSFSPFESDVSGRGRLGDNDAAVLFLESEDLAELHDAVLAQPCIAQVLSMSTEQYPTWIPHLTLGYGPEFPIEDMTAGELSEPIEFDSIGIWAGDTKMIFALTGGQNIPENISELFSDVDHVTMVDMDGMYAAGAFDESLHPRGADGQFIAKFGIIKWLKNGHWKYGRVDGINKDPKGNGVQIHATPSDLGGKPNGQPSEVLKPSQVYKAPVKQAHLPVSAPGVKKVGNQAGSNSGGLYTIPDKKDQQSPLQTMLQQGLNPQQLSDIAKGGTVSQPQSDGKKYYVKKAKTPEHGRNEELANTLYADAGVMVPAVDYSPADGNIYSPIIEGKHDMNDRLDDPEWLDKVRANFVVDAWLSNRDVFGLTYDNMLTDENGTPVRIDNGGALLYRAMGSKKTDFGSTVTELDVFRTGKKAKVFGPGMTKEQELDGAERVLAITPGQIDDRVAQAGLPKSLADTLKARRAYIASYYGLPLPESMKPADTDQVATTAPLLDPADISKGKGKSRNWFPMSLASAAFVGTTGDKIELPDKSQVGVGVDSDGNLMSTVAQQGAYLNLIQQFGADAQVMVHKGSAPNRPEHGSTLASNQLANVGWQRGDSVIDNESGAEFLVLGANKANGGMLIQQVEPDGIDPAPPFLYDSWATQPNHTAFTIKRWDPPAVVETTLDPEEGIVPAEPVVPSVPEGQAVEAAAKIKEDLVVPLPSGNGAPPAPKAAVAPGDKKMLLGDGTEASAGDTVVSKFGGEYKFVKPKGPYAVVTDPNSDDPEKLLTKKASTLLQPGKEKAAVPGEVAKPTTADGTVPLVGMMAKAKDGHEGEITQVSPDGKFVFITDANGKKKRKSVGTVTITGAPEAVLPEETPTPEPAAVPEPNTPEADASLAALFTSMVGNPTVDESEFKPIDELDLKPGDKISTDGKDWQTVGEVQYATITTTGDDPQKITTTDLNTWAVQVAAVGTPPPLPSTDEMALDLPGGYVPNEGESVVKMTPPLPNQPEYYVTDGSGGWTLLTGQGPDPDIVLSDAEMFGENFGGDAYWNVDVVHGETPPALKASPVTNLDLSDPNSFAYLSAGDQLTLGDKTYVLVGMPMMQGNNGVVAAYDNDLGTLTPLYQSAFKPGQLNQVMTNPNYAGLTALPNGADLDPNSIYDNAWKTPDLETLQGAHGNAAVSFLALQQGLDPNQAKWLAFDPSDESFWDLSDPDGTGAALKWDPTTWLWSPEPAAPAQSMQPVIKNELPPDPNAAEPTGLPTFTYTNPTGGTTVFVKTGPDTWVDQDQLDVGNDPAVVGWDEGDMALHYDWAPDKVTYVPDSNPPPGGSVVYGGYTPEPGDKVVSLTSGFNGGTVDTYWVQKPGQADWLGVLSGEDGKLNAAHPLPDSDMQIMQDLDNWNKTELYGFDSSPDTPTADPNELPGSYAPDPGETIVHTQDGLWLTSNDNGDTWQEIDQDGFLNETVWTKADLEDHTSGNYDIVQQGVSDGEPTPNLPDETAPVHDFGGYQPEPSDKILHTDDNVWLVSKDGGKTYHTVKDDGTLSTSTHSQATVDNAYPNEYGVAQEPAVPAPTVLSPPPAFHPEVNSLPGGYAPKNGKKIRTASWGATGGANTTYWESVTDKGAFWRQIMPDGTIGDKKVGTSKLPGWGSTEIFDGNLAALKDMQDGKVGPSGLPLSVIKHEPENMGDLPQTIQDYLLANPGTGLTKLNATELEGKNPGYFLTLPDGSIQKYSYANDNIFPGNGTNKTLMSAWNLKKDQPGGWTFTDVTPDSAVSTPTVNAPDGNVPGTEVPAVNTPEPAAPQPVDISAPQELTVKIPGTTDHPATGTSGYQLQPGQNLKKVVTSYGGDNWFAEVQPGVYHKINKGGGIDTVVDFDQTDFDLMAQNGNPVDTFKVPGEVPTSFGGYSALPGDTVVMNSPKGGDVNYWVKPEGSDSWHMLNPNGSMSTTDVTTDEAIEWGMNTPEMGTEVVFGAFTASKPSVTPPAVTTPGASAATKINFADLSTDAGPLNDSGKQALEALGEIPEGHTLWTYQNGDFNYLVSNTGDSFYVTSVGTLSKTVLPGGSKQVKIGAPAKSPLTSPPVQITGYEAHGLPDPATLDKVDSSETITVPEDGAWAYTPYGQYGAYMKLAPGTYDLSAGQSSKVTQVAYVNENGVVDAPGPPSTTGLALGEYNTFYLAPEGSGSVPGAPAVTAPVSTATAPEPAVSHAPKWPGEKLPTQADIASWGGPLTKDGHIPTVGMFVKRGAMTGKIVSINKEANKATVITSDGKKSLRQIDLLQTDSTANYKAYAPKTAPVDIPAGVPINIDPPAEAITKTMKDGKWRPIMSGSGGIRGGEMIVSSVTTPSGKKVARVHLTLTNEQRELLKTKLAMGGPAALPVQKGDWVTTGKSSGDVAIGDNIPMRKSSTPNDDGTPKWKVDASITPPTHIVTKVEDGAPGKKIVTMKDIATGEIITSSFVTNKTLTTYTWDPEKVKPQPPQPAGSFKVGGVAAAQGWKAVNDGGIASITGGVNGKLDAEPGKDIPAGATAIPWMKGQQHARKVGTDGVVIEVLGISATEGNSANGQVAITLPEGVDEKALGAALNDLGIPYTPVTQDNAKVAVRGMLRQMMYNNISQTHGSGVSASAQDPDTTMGWSDTKLWAEAAKTWGVPDIGWQDVMIGTDEDTGKVEYFWSPRIRDAIAAKTKFTSNLRGFTTITAATIKSNLLTGTANGILKRVGGMTANGGPGSGMSPGSDSKNMAAHGSFSSMSGNKGKLPTVNDIYTTKKSNGVVYMDHMAVLGRIMDYRASGPNADNFGAGSGKGTNSAAISLKAQQSSDFWLGGGVPPGQIGFIGINPGPGGNAEKERKKAIAELKADGIHELWGRPIEEIILPMSEVVKKTAADIPKATFPANGRPITDLPAGYTGAGPAVAAGVAA